MIYITGDIHGDFDRFIMVKKAKIRKNDTLIVCGDFGFIWDDSKKEHKILNKIGKKKYNVVFVDGYNDNNELLLQYETSKWCGGEVRIISKRLMMLKRGEIYNIEGYSVFAFGGGDSREREQNFVNEYMKLPTQEEMEYAKQNLMSCNNNVDIIVTHDSPAKVKLFLDMTSNEYSHLNTFFDYVSQNVKFKKWYFGKYHQNKKIPPCYQMLFTEVIKWVGN